MDNNGYSTFVSDLYTYLCVDHYNGRDICKKTDFAYQVDQTDLLAQLGQ